MKCVALPWSVFFGYSACISLYPACISLYPDIYLYLAILQHIHCIPLYPTVSTISRLYLTISTLHLRYLLYPAVSHCISPYLTASKTGYNQKYTPGGGGGMWYNVVSVTRRSSGVAPRACVRVHARVLVPPNIYIHTQCYCVQ